MVSYSIIIYYGQNTSAMAKKRTKNLMVMTVRLHPKLYEKLGWLATERNDTIADTIRTILATATRGVMPPKALKSREIVCEENEWGNWEKVAVSMNTSVDKLVGRLMNGLAARSGFLNQENEVPLAPDQQTE